MTKLFASICLLLFININVSFSSEHFYALKAKSIKGEEINFSDFKGKTILFVNIASRCGFTPQLESLQELYEKYRAKNFIIVGVPSNEFGGQSPEADGEMAKFCKLNYGVNFTLMSKSSVKGKNKNSVFKFLIENSKDKSEISWNFEKFLVDQNGKVVARFRSGDSPLGDKVVNKVKSLIN